MRGLAIQRALTGIWALPLFSLLLSPVSAAFEPGASPNLEAPHEVGARSAAANGRAVHFYRCPGGILNFGIDATSSSACEAYRMRLDRFGLPRSDHIPRINAVVSTWMAQNAAENSLVICALRAADGTLIHSEILDDPASCPGVGRRIERALAALSPATLVGIALIETYDIGLPGGPPGP